eukprot:m.250317 g.250317  ORF g.250317 m.250317 type:complete len:582 (-) comp16639_c0_seq1:396-2141(-)
MRSSPRQQRSGLQLRSRCRAAGRHPRAMMLAMLVLGPQRYHSRTSLPVTTVSGRWPASQKAPLSGSHARLATRPLFRWLLRARLMAPQWKPCFSRTTHVALLACLLIAALGLIACGLLLSDAPASASPEMLRSRTPAEKSAPSTLNAAILADPRACERLPVNSSLAQPTAALHSAFARFKKARRPKDLTYCMARCDLRLCCADQMKRGWAWLDVVKDDVQLAHPDDDVTLITQGTIDRIANVDFIDAAWPGPKVVVFSLYNNTTTAQAARFNAFKIAKAAQRWTNVKVVIAQLQSDHDYFMLHLKSVKAPLLPINTLRNIGVDHALTNYVFPLDIDFVPSVGLYHKLRTFMLPLANAIDRVVLVVPHWETFRCDKTVEIPQDFGDLERQVQVAHARPFHVAAPLLIQLETMPQAPAPDCEVEAGVWTPGIRTSNYHRWFVTSQTGEDGMFPLVTDTGPMQDRYYEPFVVVRRVERDRFVLPRYPEEFVGRYKNKIAFVSALRSYGYKFFTVLREFVVHYPHAISNQSSPDSMALLVMMRTLHREQRHWLLDHVYDPNGRSHPQPRAQSDWDAGFTCLLQDS